MAVGFKYAGLSNDIFALARLNLDGSLDNTFGYNGIMTTDIGQGDYARAIAIQNDGQLVVAGSSANGTVYDMVVARYNSSITSSSTHDVISKSVKIFPNPAIDQVNISTEQELSNATIKLLSTTGQSIIQQENINGSIFSLDVSLLGNGLYFLEIKEGETTSRIKVVKN